MTKQQFIDKYNLSRSADFHYRRNYPNLVNDDGSFNFKGMDEFIEENREIKERAKNILADKRGLDIREFFSGKYAAEQACVWLQHLYRESLQVIIRPSVIERCKLILKKFEETEDEDVKI